MHHQVRCTSHLTAFNTKPDPPDSSCVAACLLSHKLRVRLTNSLVSQGERRDSKTFVVVDEDCGIPTSVVESFRGFHDGGPLGQSDPRTFFLSMSEYDKPQSYDVYGEFTFS